MLHMNLWVLFGDILLVYNLSLPEAKGANGSSIVGLQRLLSNCDRYRQVVD